MKKRMKTRYAPLNPFLTAKLTRKLCVVALVVLGLIGQVRTVAAQGPFSQPPVLGVLGGLSSAKLVLSGDGVTISFDARTGFAVGFSLMQSLNPAISFELDGLYVQKGFEASSGGETASMSLDYLVIPALLRYQIGGSAAVPFVVGGAEVGYLTKCTGSFIGEGLSISEGCGSTVQRIDYGLVFGGGVAMSALSVSVRYSHGVANVIDLPLTTSRNRVIMIMVGYRLPT